MVSASRLKSERIRRTVSEPTATAKPQRITNVSSAETPARRTRIGKPSNVAVRRSNNLIFPERLMTKLGDAGRRRPYGGYGQAGTW